VRGTRKVLVKDQLKLIELGKEWRERGKENPIYKWGTGCSVEPYYQIGALPVKNLTTNIFPEHEKLSGHYLRKTFKLRHKTCFNCFMTHNHYVEVTEGPYKGFIAEEPEYENITAFGFNWGIPDLGAVTKISDLCDRLGMDSLGLSWPVSMTAEAYEKGLLTKEDLGGIDLRWGNAEAFMELMKKIARRDGIGDVLAEGAAFGAERLGGELPSFAVHCKNMSIKCVDIRALWGRCLAFSVAHSGPTTEHLPGLASGGIDAELGFPKPLKLRSTK